MALMKRLLIPTLRSLSIPPAASRFHRNVRYYAGDTFFVDYNTSITTFHVWKAKKDADGFHLRIFMSGVPKKNVKLWVEGAHLIAEGRRDKDSEDEDDSDNVMQCRVMSPPESLFDLGAVESDINNGLIKVFVPRRSSS